MLKIALYQHRITAGDRQANLSEVRKTLEECHDFDILVLPEMFSTGYLSHPSELAEPSDGYTMKSVSELSAEYGVAVCGSFIACEGNVCFNRSFFATPDGMRHFCDKRHLFILGGESEAYGRGSEKLVVEYKGFRIALFVCFDLRFPVWSRNVAGDAYDAAVYVANWPEARVREWDTLLAARAIENQAYVCGVNICSSESSAIRYVGHSAVYDFRGRNLTGLYEDSRLILCELDLNKLMAYRRGFPALECQDCFTLKI